MAPSSRLQSTAYLIAFLLFASNAFANDYPKRKAGHWEITVSNDQAPGGPQSIKQCVDETTDEKMFRAGTDMMGQMGIQCAKNEMKKQGTSFVHESDCTFSGSRIQTKGSFSGDFVSSYSGESVSSYTPAMMGVDKATTKFSAKHLGPCPAGQRPGDMTMPNGMTMNMDAIGKIPGQSSR